MYCVGLTGTIASGKTTISRLFKERGIAVISADEVARNLTTPEQPALVSIEQRFGKAVLSPSGELNRTALREIIFKEPEHRQWLEKLLHPLIRQEIRNKIEHSNSPYSVIEIPLLNKRCDYPYLNRVLLVQASREQQIKRVMARDQCSREHAEAILATQNDEARLAFVDDLVINNGSITELEKKIENLHEQYLQLASQTS